MTSDFILYACLLAIAAAAPLLIALLGRGSPNQEQREIQKARNTLAAARAQGVLSDDEYQAKLAQYPLAESNRNTKQARIVAALVVIALPLAALALYQQFGNVDALNPDNHRARTAANGDADGTPAPDLVTALAGLEARLQANPDDPEGWHLLVRGYQSAQQFDKALVAMGRLRDLLPDDIDAQVGYAEALALATPNRNIDDEAAGILEVALQRDPKHQRALWLSGMASMQRGDRVTALRYWRTLESLLPEGSENRAALAEQLRSIDPEGLENAPTTATSNDASNRPATTAALPAAASLTVSVQLDPALQSKVSPDDTLFVFARAASGPRAPLAIQRLKVSDLPAVVQLDDSMSMMPSMKLSNFPEIVIGARISRSGNATASSGDFQIITEAMQQSTIKDRVQLTISEVVP